MKKVFVVILLLAVVLSGVLMYVFTREGGAEKLSISLFYSDNATLPFKKDWLTIQTIEEKYNVSLNFEPIPISDYQTKVGLALSTGQNAPDVILNTASNGQNASLALSGSALPISDYEEFTPHFNAHVQNMNLQTQVDRLKLGDGKRYYMPQLFDVPFYDGGLILREDFLNKNNLSAPKTFDDLYNILKLYKEQNPSAYPLTTIVAPRVLYRMTMPSFGISLGLNSATSTNTLSYDYQKEAYFMGAISQEYKDYITFFHKLYEEKLLDPEMTQDATLTSKKLSTGQAMAVYGYYDQIGGWTEATNIEGFQLQLYPPLMGTKGAHHQPKNVTGPGLMFPVQIKQDKRFEEKIRKLDEIFFSEEGAKIWSIGVENKTYTMNNGQITYNADILNSKEGVYKYMQTAYGCGCDGLQTVWMLDRELTKYDENYKNINQIVQKMQDAIQYIPAPPQFDEVQAEKASLLQTTLSDAFEQWNDAFLTGKKDIEQDFDAYVEEMKSIGIEEFLGYYNVRN